MEGKVPIVFERN